MLSDVWSSPSRKRGDKATPTKRPQNRNTHTLRTLVTICLILLLSLHAHAQRLDLGPSATTPKPGDGLAALTLADLLDNEARALQAPDETAHAALRRLASRLLREGENAGQPGSEAVLAGLTLASNRAELDTLLTAQDTPTRRYIADIIDTTEHSIRPREIDLLLRDALAPLVTNASPNCGWWLDEPATTPHATIDTTSLAALLDHRFITDNATTALTQLIELCQAAEHEPAYRNTAVEWADLVTRAARALDEPANWLDMPARDRLRADLSAGLELLFDEPETARASLARTATLLDIINATDALDSKLQSRDLRDAVNRLVAAADGDPKRAPDTVHAIATAYLRALKLLDAETTLPPPNALVRQVRPLREPLSRAHRTSADRLALRLPDILATPDPMTNPGLLAAINALTRTAADLALPQTLSTMLTTWTGDPSRPPPPTTREPMPTRELGALAVHIQQLAIAASKPAEAANALAQLRELADIAAFVFHMPGEDELRRGGQSSGWPDLTANQRDRIVFVLDQARAEWIRSAASDDAPATTARLRTIASAIELLRDGAEISVMRRAFSRGQPPAINAWPGIELTQPALDTLAENLNRDLPEIATLIARDDDLSLAESRIEVLHKAFAAVRLIARLERTARTHSSTTCSPATELALGPPLPNAWLRLHRHQLATICRAGFEASASRATTRQQFSKQANTTAAEVLSALR
ncbi:MAG: hypothetical protein Q9O74_08840 [Planctomycetota bacterium]|nr:hypothetical protein [Planctomycetota bacterium]